MKKRWYIHGDIREDGCYFDHFDDLFYPVAELSQYKTLTEHHQRFLKTLTRYRNSPPEFREKYHRPDDSENLFAKVERHD